MHFTDEDNLWVMGDHIDGNLQENTVRSTNAGVTWPTLAGWGDPAPTTVGDIWMMSASNGIAVCDTFHGEYGIFRTTNGATSWSALHDAGDKDLNAIWMVDANTGYAVGNEGTILKTEDGGSNWTAQTSGTTSDIYDVCFYDEDHGWAGAISKKLYTSDGGDTWNIDPDPVEITTYYGIHVVDRYNVWAVGGNGHIYKYVVDPEITTIAQWDEAANTTFPQGFSGDIRLTGLNLQDSSQVTISGTGVSINSLTQTISDGSEAKLNVTISPTAAAGSRTITITNVDTGTNNYVGGFSLTGRPSISAVTPDSAYQGWSNTVTITGANFVSGATVDLGSDITVMDTTFVDATELQVKINVSPSAATGARTIKVINPDTGEGTSTFTVLQAVNPPTISNVKFNNVGYDAFEALGTSQEVGPTPAISFNFLAPQGVSDEGFILYVDQESGFSTYSIPATAFDGSSTSGTVTWDLPSAYALSVGYPIVTVYGEDDLGAGASRTCNLWVKDTSGLPRKLAADIVTYPSPWDPSLISRVTMQFDGLADIPNCYLHIFNTAGEVMEKIALDVNEGTNQVTWDGSCSFGTRVPSGIHMIAIVKSDGTLVGKGMMPVFYNK